MTDRQHRRSQTITGYSMSSAQRSEYIESEPIAVWLCRDMLATTIDIAGPEDEAEDLLRIYVHYETVERLELARVGGTSLFLRT